MSVEMKETIRKSVETASASVHRKILRVRISAKYWAERSKATLSNTSGAGAAMDTALGLIIGIVLAIVVLEALKNLFNVDILPQVTDKIDSMWG